MSKFSWTPEALSELQQLHEAGAGTGELAEALGTTPPTIRRKLAQVAADAGGDAGGDAALVGFAPGETEAAQAEETEQPGDEQPAAEQAEDEAVEAPVEEAAEAPRARSRVDVTMEMLRREQGATVAELAKAFADEFGDGKVSTAQQARYKVPAKFGLKATNMGKQEGREGSVYKLDE